MDLFQTWEVLPLKKERLLLSFGLLLSYRREKPQCGLEAEVVMESNQRTHQIIESLLAKPTKKPDFKSFKGSDILKRAQEFIPMFISTTDRLLSDPELLKQRQMDIHLEEDIERIDDQSLQEQPLEGQIQMDIGIGVYDVGNQDFDEKTFKPSSTRPIVKFNGLEENDDDGSSSDSSENSDLYYEFNSDSDIASNTTKSAVAEERKRPLIQDITSSKMQNKPIKNKNKRKRNQK